jgi:hypothetical protein
MPEVIATGLLVSLFTAQMPSGNLGPSGAPDGLYIDVAGLVNIRCTAPPPSDARIQATEIKQLADISAAEMHHVLLDAWYPALDNGWRDGWRCVVDSVAYDIMGVESDSQMRMTRVMIKLVTV